MKRRKQIDAVEKERILAELRRDVAMRQQGYRERALRLFPHVCARCGRTHEGVKLRELTVHHKDHNHDNNPPDGSNWELLCVYCHDHEHEKYKMAGLTDGTGGGTNMSTSRPMFSPFAGLGLLVKPGPPKSDENAKQN